MKKILDTLKSKWAEYLLEIIVITIGILAAFTLNEWKESIQDSTLEHKILKNLEIEINDNINQLEENLIKHEKKKRKTIELLNHFSADYASKDHSAIDSLLIGVELHDSFDPYSGTIKSIISSGNIRVIKSDTISRFITSFEEVLNDKNLNAERHLIERFKEFRQRKRIYMGSLSEERATRLKRNWGIEKYSSKFKTDYTGFINDHALEQIILDIIIWRGIIIKNGNLLINEMKDISSSIEKEIEKLN